MRTPPASPPRETTTPGNPARDTPARWRRVVPFLLVVPAIAARPQRGLLLLAVLTPFDGLVPLLRGPGALAGWKEALLALTLVCALFHRRRGPAAPGSRHMPWWPAVAALVVVGSVSAIATAGVAGLHAIKVTFFWALVLVVVRCAPFVARDRDLLVTTLMATGVVTAAVGLLQQVVGADALVRLGYTYNEQVRFAGGFLRSFSTFNQPFPFALFLVVSLLVGGAVALAEPRRTRNWLFLLASPLLVAGMAASIVRGGVLALAVGLLWLGVLRYRKLLALAVAGGIAAAAAAFVLLPAGAIQTALSPASLGERITTWLSSIEPILTAPLGRGLGTTGAAADRISVYYGTVTPTPIPDNYYVKLLYELGPVGFWLFVLLLVSAIGWSARLARRLPGREGAFALGVSASVFSVVASSVVATYLEIFPLDFYFWLLLGGVACAHAQAGSSSPLSSSDREALESRPMPVS